jgi:hypothetical protein
VIVKSLSIFGAICAIGLASHVQAATVDLTAMQLNGTASLDGSEIVLTPALNSQNGSAFTTSAVALGANTAFSASFELSITDPGFSGADGLVFVMQNNAPTATGTGGGGIGYLGIDNSIGIEFDTYNNGTIDNGSENHVGINVNGSTNSVALASPTFDLDNSSIFAWVDFDGSTLSVSVNNTNSKPGSALLSYATDLSALGGQAFLGFTGSTGSANAEHRVVSFDFAVAAPAVPLPAAGWMLLAGVGGLAALRRKARKG